MTKDNIQASDADLFGLLNCLRLSYSFTEEAELIAGVVGTPKPIIVSFLNQHGFNLAAANLSFLRQLERADLLLRDGVGVEIALSMLGRPAGRNMNGTDLIPRLIEKFSGRRIVIFGTREPWVGTAAARLKDGGADVVAALDGFQEGRVYIDVCRDKRPSLVVLGMGMPRQEELAEKIRAAADWPVVIVNGGAVLDFLGGRFMRAPRWMQHFRLEWVVRMAQEPSRLAPRYVSGGIGFLLRAHALKSKLGGTRN